MISGKYEYFAFISYKEEDTEWAKWLQKKLEHYKLPTALRKENPELPERISPIYEYKSEAGGGRLKEVLWKGLTSSKYLIVICSPRATRSEWLNSGIRYFVTSGQEENIIPFIIEGKPKSDDPDTECFPSELLKLTGDRELRGININEMGRDAAAVKVAAVMLGVKFDTLWRRYERERNRRRTIIWLSALVLTLLLIGSLWVFWNNRLLQESNLKIQKIQSRFIAEKVNGLIENGDAYTATLLALEALPNSKEHRERPYVTEAEYALRQVAGHSSAILKLPKGKVKTVSFSRNGRLVLTLCEDNSIQAWDSRTGALIDGKTVDTADSNLVTSEARAQYRFGPLELTRASDNEVRLTNHDERMYRQLWSEPTDSISCVALSADAAVAASGAADGYLRLVSMTDGKITESIKAHQRAIRSVVFSPDGKNVVTASNDGTAKIWSCPHPGRPILLCGHTGNVFSAHYSPDGKRILTASQDSTMRLWDARTGRCTAVLRGHQSTVRYACFSPDGKLIASASYDKEVWVWDAATLQPVMKLKGHSSSVTSVCFSPDSRLLASASWDNTIKLWNLANGSIDHEWTAHHRGIHLVRFSPDGKTIASASWENNAKVWDTATGRIIHELKGADKMITSVSYFPDGRNILTSSADGAVRAWDFLPLQELIDQTHDRFKGRELTPEERREYYLEE